jgi:ADP-ribose pyrophosphatase
MPPFEINKLTDCRWLNLFEMCYRRGAGHPRRWMLCSRKAHPVVDAAAADAAVIVPIVKTETGPRLVVTKEFRPAIWDWEYGFPAGLIDAGESVEDTVRRELKEETGLTVTRIVHISPAVYSSAGLSDESCRMVLVEATGSVSAAGNADGEEIETLLMDTAQLRELLGSDHKIAAKAWGLLYHFAVTGRIAFPPNAAF